MQMLVFYLMLSDIPTLQAYIQLLFRKQSCSPCGVLGRGWTTCLLHDSPLFGSLFNIRVGVYVWSEISYIHCYFLPRFTVSCMKLVVMTCGFESAIDWCIEFVWATSVRWGYCHQDYFIDENFVYTSGCYIFLHIFQLLGGSVIFTENLREISRLLEKLQGFICWKSAFAESWGGQKLRPYKWKGDESGFKSCFNHE